MGGINNKWGIVDLSMLGAQGQDGQTPCCSLPQGVRGLRVSEAPTNVQAMRASSQLRSDPVQRPLGLL